MEIIKRARGVSDGEVIAWNESSANVREEANRRTAKAGYTTRDGHSANSRKIQNRGYGDSKLNQWPRDRNGNLIGE